MKSIAAIILALGVASCSALGRQAFQNPVVNLRDVKVQGLGLSGGQLEVRLSVYNPNTFRLDASRLTYKVFVGDSTDVATGAVDTRTSVQAGDSTVINVPVAFTYAGIGAAATQLLRTGSVNYRVTGDVTVASVVGNFTVPYSATGRFNTIQ